MSYLSKLNTLVTVKNYSSALKIEEKSGESHPRGMSAGLFFLFLCLFQLLFIFQGADVGDSGSYATFYEQIFNDPESVQYSFMFWFSGIVGGLYMKLLPSLGILGIRIAGVLISTSTIIVTYNLLKRYVNQRNLQLGLFILVLFVNNNPKEFYYNNFSAFLYVVTAFLLFKGLKFNKRLLIILSGVFISLNMFNRFPNLLGLGLIITIFYYGYLNHQPVKKQLTNSLLLVSGFIAGTIIICLIMYLIGHLAIYMNSLKLLFSMGKTANHSPAHQNGYDIFNMIKVLIKQYTISVFLAVITFFFILTALLTANKIKKNLNVSKYVISILKYGLILLLIALIISRIINNISLLYFFTGLSLVTGLMVLLGSKNNDLRFLTVLGCFIALVHPMGSSEGIHTVIIYSLWICFPIAIDYLLNLKFLAVDLKIFINKAGVSTNFLLNEYELKEAKRIGIGVMIFACLYYSYFYPYFDKTNRLNMNYSVNNYHMKGIYTSAGRANALNELLNASAKYVKPNDYVFAYDCIPLYYYLTDTKPFIKNSWPWLYQPEVFKRELDKAAIERKELPVVVTQIVKTMGDGGNWPYNPYPENSQTWKVNEERNNSLNEFLAVNSYREVWANKCFRIFIVDKNKIQ